MLITFSEHRDDPAGPSSQDAVEYPSAEWVPKPSAEGRVLIRRVPAPEILVGDPAMARAAIRAAPGVAKYRSGVMSFSREDVDVRLFNVGDAAERSAVDVALRLFLEVGFAGVPPECRPPVFISSHTHTGRFELNLLVPRWVTRSDGKVRSFNIDPPGAASRAIWAAVEDLLNSRFCWADPRDPRRQQLLHVPDWMAKEQATSKREGMIETRNLRRFLAEHLMEAYYDGRLSNRDDAVECLLSAGRHYGLVLHSLQPSSVTIGLPNAQPSERLRFRGLLFSKEFTSIDYCWPGAPVFEARLKARAEEIATSPERLQALWERRATFNRSRFGLDAWPIVPFAASEWLLEPLHPPRMIAPRRLDQRSRILEETTHEGRFADRGARRTEADEQVDAARAGTFVGGAGFSGRGQADLAGAGSEDRRSRSPDPDSRCCYHELELNAAALARPSFFGGRILSGIAARLKALIPRLQARVVIRALEQVIPIQLPLRLAELKESLEVLNGTLAYRSAPERNRGNAEARHGHDPAATSASGSAGGARHRGFATTGGHSREPRGDREEYEVLVGRPRGPHGVSRSNPNGSRHSDVDQAAGKSGSSNLAIEWTHGTHDELAGSGPPVGSRAEKLRLVLVAIHETGAGRSVRLSPSRYQGLSVGEGVGTQSTETVSPLAIMNTETWWLRGQAAEVEAILERLEYVEPNMVLRERTEPSLDDDFDFSM